MNAELLSPPTKRAPALSRSPPNKVFKLRVKLVLKSVNVHFNKPHSTPKTFPSPYNPSSVKSTLSSRAPTLSATGKGDVLAGRYTLVRELGKGGFSTVWLAHDSRYILLPISVTTALTLGLVCSTSTEVAIKIPSRPTRTQELLKLRLLPPDGQPSQLTRLLDHFPYHPHASLTCLVLSLHGPTVEELKVHLGSRRLPIGIVKRMCVDVLTALQFMHGVGQGIAHTDIQPRNILLSQYGGLSLPQNQWRFVLADLGHGTLRYSVIRLA